MESFVCSLWEGTSTACWRCSFLFHAEPTLERTPWMQECDSGGWPQPQIPSPRRCPLQTVGCSSRQHIPSQACLCENPFPAFPHCAEKPLIYRQFSLQNIPQTSVVVLQLMWAAHECQWVSAQLSSACPTEIRDIRHNYLLLLVFWKLGEQSLGKFSCQR